MSTEYDDDDDTSNESSAAALGVLLGTILLVATFFAGWFGRGYYTRHYGD